MPTRTKRPARKSNNSHSHLAELEQWHFWFVGRRSLISRLLARYLPDSNAFVLDLGCGTGSLLKELCHQGRRGLALDLRPEGLARLRHARPPVGAVQGDATQLSLGDQTIDAVLLLDVLEHTDDTALLAEVQRVLRPGGLLVVSVPTMPWVWSVRDDEAGHLRRYRRHELSSLLRAFQFAVEDMRYYQCLLFPLLAATRLLARKYPAARQWEKRRIPLGNTVTTWVNKAEARLSDFVPWPWGSSLVAVGRKGDA